MTHLSVGKLIPAIGDLPKNIVKGFDETFKFKYLEKDADVLKKESAKVVAKCYVGQASSVCTSTSRIRSAVQSMTLGQKTREVTTATEKAVIEKSFANSLDTVMGIANDKYFGTKDLQNTANNLNSAKKDFAKIKSPMKCAEAVPTFCGIWSSSDNIVTGIGTVNKAIDGFKSADFVKTFEKNKGMLISLHIMPYFLAISLAFFAFFIWKGGVLCCCRGGTCCGSLAVLGFMVFWLVSFIIYFIVLIIGMVLRYAADSVEVAAMKGKPKLDVAIKHLQDAYPEFWKLVFEPLEGGLDLLLKASFFFVVAAFLVSVYAALECCCCPWRKPKEETSGHPVTAVMPATAQPP